MHISRQKPTHTEAQSAIESEARTKNLRTVNLLQHMLESSAFDHLAPDIQTRIREEWVASALFQQGLIPECFHSALDEAYSSIGGNQHLCSFTKDQLSRANSWGGVIRPNEMFQSSA